MKPPSPSASPNYLRKLTKLAEFRGRHELTFLIKLTFLTLVGCAVHHYIPVCLSAAFLPSQRSPLCECYQNIFSFTFMNDLRIT